MNYTYIIPKYIYLYNYLCLAFGLSSILFIISYIFVQKNIYIEKISSYECGFSPFNEIKNKFDIKYYIIGILFMIFDLEIIIILPWLLNININIYFSYCIFFIFFIYLVLGFFYEIIKGLLNV